MLACVGSARYSIPPISYESLFTFTILIIHYLAWVLLWTLNYRLQTMVVAQCARTDGPTDAPITTEKPCNDKWSNCPALAEEKCYKSWVGEDCPKSCGKCPGGIIFRFEYFGSSETMKILTRRHPGCFKHLLQSLHKLWRYLQVRKMAFERTTGRSVNM